MPVKLIKRILAQLVILLMHGLIAILKGVTKQRTLAFGASSEVIPAGKLKRPCAEAPIQSPTSLAFARLVDRPTMRMGCSLLWLLIWRILEVITCNHICHRHHHQPHYLA